MANATSGKAREPQASAPPQEKNQPAGKIRLGRISCTIWENEHETQGRWFSMALTRSYKDKNGNWQSATSFGRDDLLVVAEVCRLAFLGIQKQYNATGGTTERQPGDDTEGVVDCPF